MSTGRGSRGYKRSGGRNYVNTKLLRKDLKDLGKKVNKAAESAVSGAVTQGAPFAMSFDSVEALPWIAGKEGRIILAGPGVTKAADTNLENILMMQRQVATNALESLLRRGIKEALE